MRTSTTLALALSAILVTVLAAAALQGRPEIVIDSRILSWIVVPGWW